LGRSGTRAPTWCKGQLLLAWPDVLDNVASGLLEIGKVAGGMDSGPNLGGFSRIMTGAPASTILDITSPIFDSVRIALDPKYYKGGAFTIVTKNNSADNMYIVRDTRPSWYADLFLKRRRPAKPASAARPEPPL
jgi:hypothetical protein